MKTQQLDVEMEIPYREIEELGQEHANKVILGRLRHTAESMAHDIGGSLRTTVLPEIVIKRTSSIILGGDILLVASRWTLDVPESFDPRR